MSKNSPDLELKLNLSPPRDNSLESPKESVSSWGISPESSCVSSEPAEDEIMQFPDSPEAATTTTAMVLVGCPRCLMYVMLSEVDPKCPRCHSTVLLDFLNEEMSLKKSLN